MANPLLYIAMNGAQATSFAQAINSNNLANVSTPGFKSDLAQAEQSYASDGSNSGYITQVTSHPNLAPGTMMATDRDLDVAVQGEGWFTVQAADGGEAYTRAGNFQLNALGQLVTAGGFSVMGNGGPISIPPADSMKIGTDGSITIKPSGQAANALTTIDKLKLVNPDAKQLVKGADGLFRLSSNNPAPVDANIRVQSGTLEGSNVNAVDALVNIISLSRDFEMEMKLMQQEKENGSLSAQLLQT